MRNSGWIKCLLVVLAIATAVSWVGTVFDDDGDVASLPDFQPATLEDFQTLVTLPVCLGYNFSREPRPLVGEAIAHFLEMHEKSPPPVLLPF